MKTAIVIFCDDFRIRDNPALFHAANDYENLILLYNHNDNYCGRNMGAAAKVFLHHLLKSFSKNLKDEYNAKLILRKNSDIIDELKLIAKETDFDAIYFNRSYTKLQIESEEKIKKTFANKVIKSFKGKLLFEPNEIKTSQGSYFKVFTPFSRQCLNNAELIGETLPEISHLKSKNSLTSLDLEELNLLPKDEGRWHEKLASYWEFDYKKIAKNAIKFIENDLKDYASSRNLPALNKCSKLSPYFRFGVFSPRIIYHSALPHNASQFILELLWREFAYHVMYFNQDLDKHELKPKYADFKWEYDNKKLHKWQKGETGFSFVDAGMKELWTSGFMHNRVRMVAASFLVKNLLIDWKLGEQWFFDTLVDADAAVNPFSWQWVFGSGFDAAPYFRIFNPELQREKFDAKNEYCKKWLGENYDADERKIINYDQMRKEALRRFKDIDPK